jgi:hypothetical protein
MAKTLFSVVSLILLLMQVTTIKSAEKSVSSHIFNDQSLPSFEELDQVKVLVAKRRLKL